MKPEFDHNCYDNAAWEDCENCDGGIVTVVEATTGNIVFEGNCAECDGYGVKYFCIICGREL